MLKGEWLKRGPQNYLAVVIDGKEIPLRRTVFQQECYAEHLDTKRKEAEARKAAAGSAPKDEPAAGVETFDMLQKVTSSATVDSLPVALIALNPVKDRVDWTREQLLEKVDLDQIVIIASKWLQHKVYSPEFDAKLDPQFTPR